MIPFDEEVKILRANKFTIARIATICNITNLRHINIFRSNENYHLKVWFLFSSL